MPKKNLERPDLTWSNQQISDAIAYDGTHFQKHGVADFGLKSPAEYSQLIKDVLDNPRTFGFTARAPARYIGDLSSRVPEFSTQTFYDPDKRLLVTTHLKRDLSGKMTVNGTAHPAKDGEKTYDLRREKTALTANHDLVELEKESNYFKARAHKQMGGRTAIVTAKLARLAPNMARRMFSHFGFIGAGMAAGFTKLFGGTNAQAAAAAADATPGLRIATSLNGDEMVVRTIGAYTAGLGEEPIRYVNDVLKSFNRGDDSIADGVVRDAARAVGTTIRTLYDVTSGPREKPVPTQSEIHGMLRPTCAKSASAPIVLRSRQTYNPEVNSSLELEQDPLQTLQAAATPKTVAKNDAGQSADGLISRESKQGAAP